MNGIREIEMIIQEMRDKLYDLKDKNYPTKKDDEDE
jgi:hypothetical protein